MHNLSKLLNHEFDRPPSAWEPGHVVRPFRHGPSRGELGYAEQPELLTGRGKRFSGFSGYRVYWASWGA